MTDLYTHTRRMKNPHFDRLVWSSLMLTQIMAYMRLYEQQCETAGNFAKGPYISDICPLNPNNHVATPHGAFTSFIH